MWNEDIELKTEMCITFPSEVSVQGQVSKSGGWLFVACHWDQWLQGCCSVKNICQYVVSCTSPTARRVLAVLLRPVNTAAPQELTSHSVWDLSCSQGLVGVCHPCHNVPPALLFWQMLIPIIWLIILWVRKHVECWAVVHLNHQSSQNAVWSFVMFWSC